MLISSTITNTWQCDNCLTQVVSEVDPFFSLQLTLPSMPQGPKCTLDICQTCITLIPFQAVMDYVESLSKV